MRADQFKNLNKADQNYNQKATDSLLNFETVKYFNAEKHEEQRFDVALSAYKYENVKLQFSLVKLTIVQSFLINTQLGISLALAFYFTHEDMLTIGGFVMFNSYIL